MQYFQPGMQRVLSKIVLVDSNETFVSCYSRCKPPEFDNSRLELQCFLGKPCSEVPTENWPMLIDDPSALCVLSTAQLFGSRVVQFILTANGDNSPTLASSLGRQPSVSLDDGGNGIRDNDNGIRDNDNEAGCGDADGTGDREGDSGGDRGEAHTPGSLYESITSIAGDCALEYVGNRLSGIAVRKLACAAVVASSAIRIPSAVVASSAIVIPSAIVTAYDLKPKLEAEDPKDIGLLVVDADLAPDLLSSSTLNSDRMSSRHESSTRSNSPKPDDRADHARASSSSSLALDEFDEEGQTNADIVQDLLEANPNFFASTSF